MGVNMGNSRNYVVIIGSKQFFDVEIEKLLSTTVLNEMNNFPQMVRRHDEHTKNIFIEGANKEKKDPFKRTDLLVIKNSDYHSIVQTAHDRLAGVIEDLTLERAQIIIHNPTRSLEEYLKSQKEQEKIEYSCISQQHNFDIVASEFNRKMRKITSKVMGQKKAISDIGKSLWYLTKFKRDKPFVFMLYGSSSVGKTETVKEIAKEFFYGNVFEKHLSMFRNERAQYFLFGDDPNRSSIGYELLERKSNLVFLDEFDKLPDYFYSVFYTLFDNTQFSDSTYNVDISGLIIFLTSNYSNMDEMKKHLGLPIFYRIDKFVHYEDFSTKTIFSVTKKEVLKYVSESEGIIEFEDLLSRVKSRTYQKGENARTIKNIVLQEVEDILYKEVLNSNETTTEASDSQIEYESK